MGVVDATHQTGFHARGRRKPDSRDVIAPALSTRRGLYRRAYGDHASTPYVPANINLRRDYSGDASD